MDKSMLSRDKAALEQAERQLKLCREQLITLKTADIKMREGKDRQIDTLSLALGALLGYALADAEVPKALLDRCAAAL